MARGGEGRILALLLPHPKGAVAITARAHLGSTDGALHPVPAAAAITLGDLSVERGGRRVVDGVTATVPAGRITGLIGPSGCGKSSLMRAIVGVQARVTGTLEVLGLPAGAPSLRSRIGYLTQAPAVYADLTARENLRYFAAVLGAPGAAASTALEAVELREFADIAVGRLSGGQQARVSLATALLGEPEVLILDEPTVGLDPVLRRDLWSLFRRLAGGGATLLISSHVMDEAEHCDRILLMREGQLLADGTRDELLQRARAPSLEEAFLRLVGERRS